MYIQQSHNHFLTTFTPLNTEKQINFDSYPLEFYINMKRKFSKQLYSIIDMDGKENSFKQEKELLKLPKTKNKNKSFLKVRFFFFVLCCWSGMIMSRITHS